MRTLLLILFLSYSTCSFAQNLDNYPFLIKDKETLAQILSGTYPTAAMEIGAKKPYQNITKKGYPIRIAIDPGHIAGSKKEAILEERYINGQAGFFYEAELTSATATILKHKLESRGFQVMVTRNSGETALGMSYKKWYKHYKESYLLNDLTKGAITKDQYEDFLTYDEKTLFDKYFKDKDFIERSTKINAFNPDITLIIHYNVSEFKNTPDTYAPIVSTNYSVAFVPGGFTNSELVKESQLEDFVRLASTDILPKSILLSSFIMSEFQSKLAAPNLLPTDNTDLWYLKKYSIYTNQPGVFSRNLYMTRAIQSPLCYAECLLQNNEQEIKLLTNKNLKIAGIKTSARVEDVANACYSGIIKYFTSIGYLN